MGSDLVTITDGNLLTLEMDESMPNWPAVVAFVNRHGALDITRTEASSSELLAAETVRMERAWYHGYPQPERDFAYLGMTYDLRAYCARCGVGAIQKAPFRMRAEPKWGKHSSMQLVWVFDEFFVRPEVWEHVFEPLGIDKVPVVQNTSGEPLETVVQLSITDVSDSPLDMDNHPFQDCSNCGRRKYFPHTRGCFPSFLEAPSARVPLLKTRESFGDGSQAFRAVIGTQPLYRSVRAAKIRDLVFLPVCSPADT